MNNWKQDEIDKFIDLYPNNTNKELSILFNKSINIISHTARNLKLYKSKEYRKNLKNRYVHMSYDELCNISKKYKTLSDFKKYDNLAYSKIEKLDIKDDICCHIIPQHFSTPQLILKFLVSKIFNTNNILYNTRKIIKPYELDIFLPDFNLAFEYDGIHWHKDKKDVDELKNEMCEKLNIQLIRITEKTKSNKNYIYSIKMIYLIT
jgi:very-short-patch-repair endonuclease